MGKTPSSKRALVVELTKYHGYMLYPQCYMLLDAGYEVTVLVSELNRDIHALNAIRNRIQILEIPENQLSFFSLLRYWRKMRVHRFKFVTFNTMSTPAMLLGLMTPTEVRFIYHHDHITGSSLLHTIVMRMARRKARTFFLISEHLYQTQKRSWQPEVLQKMAWFDPSYLQDYANQDGFQSLQRNERVVFVIPGQVTSPQRNYTSLIDSFRQIAKSELKDRIQINILGNYFTSLGRSVVREAYETGIIGNVLRLQYEKYSPFEKFAAELRGSHFIIPLLDDRTANLKNMKYNTETVSTSTIMGRAFALPFVVSDKFPVDEDLKPFCVQFSGDNLFEGLRRAIELVDSGEYQRMRKGFQSYMRERYALSQANYIGPSETSPD